jgi:hypothetical protein
MEVMDLKRLAESVILQSLEDLYDSDHRAESIHFFTNRDFRVFAKMAGMNIDDKIRLLRLVRQVGRYTRKARDTRVPKQADRAKSSPVALSASPFPGHRGKPEDYLRLL